jgi:hypothetical protein
MRIRKLGVLLGIAVFVLTAAGCTPEEIALFQSVTGPYQSALSDDQLTTLRQCESSGNYESVSAGGRYRGAYQFDQETWDGVASRNFPWLAGNDPAETEPWWQDAMARALFTERGAGPWGGCGKRL